MESNVIPLSDSPSVQRPPSAAELLSAELLQYQLSRTPTPRRFNRKRLAVQLQAQKLANTSDQDNHRHSGADFKLASELINNELAIGKPDQSSKTTKQTPFHSPIITPPNVRAALSPLKQPATPAPRDRGIARRPYMAAVPEVPKTPPGTLLFGQEADDMTLNDAIHEAARIKRAGLAQRNTKRDIRTIAEEPDHASVPQVHLPKAAQPLSSPSEKNQLKRPTKRTPLRSGSPAVQRQVSEKTPDRRQFSIPDEEILPKPKKRPRARRLPLDELQLVDQRVPSYDAPPISDSEDADSDPVEEQADDAVRSRSKAKDKITNRGAAATKKKPIPVRTRLQSQRSQLLAGLKVIKRLVVPLSLGQKDIATSGDGFEGPERLPTGRVVRSANKRRHARPRTAQPMTYFRTLEIVESKPSCSSPQAGSRLPRLKVEDTILASVENHGIEIASRLDPTAHDHTVEEEPGMLFLADQLDKADMADISSPQGLDEDDVGTHEIGILELPISQGAETEANVQTFTLGRDEPEGTIADALPDLFKRDRNLEDNTVTVVNPQQESAASGRRPFCLSDENGALGSDLPVNEPGSTHSKPSVERNESLFPGRELKRTVTFSDVVKVETDLEFDSEDDEDEKTDSESQSPSVSGSDPEQVSEKSQDSDAEDTPEEDSDIDDAEGDDESKDEDEDHEYPSIKTTIRNGSPELVSSGFYAVQSNGTQPCFSFQEDSATSRYPVEKDCSQQEEEGMILDEDDEVEQVAELPPLDYPRARGLEDFIDSDEQMLIATSQATSSPKQPLSQEDCNDLDVAPTASGKRETIMRKGHPKPFDDAPNSHVQWQSFLCGNMSNNVTDARVMGDEDLPSTRDVNYEDPYQSDEDEEHFDDQTLLLNGPAKTQRCPASLVSTPCSSLTKATSDPEPKSQDHISARNQRNRPSTGATTKPATAYSSLATQASHYGVPHSGQTQLGPNKLKRAKTGLSALERPPPRSPAGRIAVADVPSYFRRASQAFSSPSMDATVMMRRAKTLPSTQYVSESGDEDGFIVMSDESFKNRLSGRKRHLSLSDRVDAEESIGLKEVVNKSNVDMGRSFGVKRKRSLPFKSPFKERSTVM